MVYLSRRRSSYLDPAGEGIERAIYDPGVSPKTYIKFTMGVLFITKKYEPAPVLQSDPIAVARVLQRKIIQWKFHIVYLLSSLFFFPSISRGGVPEVYPFVLWNSNVIGFSTIFGVKFNFI